MFRDVLAPQARAEDWPALRDEIEARVVATMGRPPDTPHDDSFEILDEERQCGLFIRKIRFEPAPGIVSFGRIAAAEDRAGCRDMPGVVCIHGTNHELAHRSMLDPEKCPRRQYAVELALRGCVTISVDQYGFGEGNAGRKHDETVRDFYAAYPDWSLDGVRLAAQKRAVDILRGLPEVDAGRIGCIGNSLGGRAAIYLAALDRRISAAVVSAGISPNLSNLFRNLPNEKSLSPALGRHFLKHGTPPFEYQEMISLVAPRGLLIIEPWNDPYNPMIEPVWRCVEKARFVWALHGAHDGLQFLCHGDGHDTRDDVRRYAYDFLVRHIGGE